MAHQHSLFGPELRLPSGFRYQSGLISPDEETDLLQRLSGLPFRAFEFHGYVGKRRVISFGWEYDFSREKVRRAEAIPAFLLPLREKAATFAGLASMDLPHVLVTEYTTGATIGWHKDKGVFGDVIGISLGSPCTFRLRRRTGARW